MDDEASLRARFSRQILLTGVGEAGQHRLCAATARLPSSGLEGEIARRYAVRSGIAGVTDGPREHAPDFVTTPAARAILEGSLAALREIVAALGPR